MEEIIVSNVEELGTLMILGRADTHHLQRGRKLEVLYPSLGDKAVATYQPPSELEVAER